MDELAPGGVELPPDIFKRGLIDISDNNAAARTTEDVAEGINVHALGREKIRLANLFIPSGRPRFFSRFFIPAKTRERRGRD